jgi:hypothetical protein
MGFPVVFEHPVTQKKKIVSPGFDWVAFFSPLVFGIPFFIRRQWVLAILCLILGSVIPLVTADVTAYLLETQVIGPDENLPVNYDPNNEKDALEAASIIKKLSASTALFALFVLIVAFGVISRKNHVRTLVKSGWKISGENDEHAKTTLMKWGIAP